MASNPPGQCCVETNFHEGTPVGKHEQVFGLNTYVTGANNPDSRVIVVLTDIYGNEYNNVLLIADQLAKKGNYRVYIPDILKGDPVTPGDDLGPWLEKHTAAITEPIIEGFLSKLRAQIGSSAFVGLIGYCFGAKYTIQQLAEGGLATAGAVAHPSFVTIGEVAAIKKPLLISAAEQDPIFTVDLRHQTEAKLAEIKARYALTLFGGVSHGFAVRGDVKDPVVKHAMTKVLADQLEWFALF